MNPTQGPFNIPEFKASFKNNMSCISVTSKYIKQNAQVKFSPFRSELLALACSENFALAGKGRLFILKMGLDGKMDPVSVLDEKDSVFDCSWSEENENLIAVATNKAIKMQLVDPYARKVIHTIELKGEIYCIEFSHKNMNLCLSSGIFGTINLVDFSKGQILNQFYKHDHCAYHCTWHPTNEKLFASCGGDALLRIWDITSPKQSIAVVHGHEGEILSCDFNKYVPQIATGSIDKTIKIWDLRKINEPLTVLPGHRYAVRKVKFSPHDAPILASASYDMNVNIWNLEDQNKPLKITHKEHTEFVIGLDFNLFNKKQIASCSWDSRCYVWNWDQPQPKLL